MTEQVESKICLTHRLQREGRWEAATSYLDAKREELRAEGMTKKQANAAAWRALAEKFPPPAKTDRWDAPAPAAVATMDAELDPATAPATAVEARPGTVRIPPANHRIYGIADADLEIFEDEYAVHLSDRAKGYLGAVMAHYWTAGRAGTLPQVDCFAD